jgi:polar amino acid transport system substrate-binding protein
MFLNRSLSHGLLAAALASAAMLTACATAPVAASIAASTIKPDAQTVATLAPTGKLRIGVYRGSPTSMVVNSKTGESKGVALQLGQALAKQLDVPYEIVEFPRLAEVLIAMKTDAGKSAGVDITFTNATAARAKDVDFTSPLVSLELGYLVPQNSAIKSVGDVDKPGVRVGVAQGSSSQTALGEAYTQAKLSTTPSLKEAGTQLTGGQLDAFATNKAILFELKDSLPPGQFRILDDRWGLEHLAIAIPKRRDSATPFMKKFTEQAIATGLLKQIIQEAGLRGTAEQKQDK